MRIQFVQDVIDKVRKKKKEVRKEVDTIFYVIKALKEYRIKDIVASPGTQNASFNYLVQKDSFFRCVSVIDERSAAYVASGMSFETGLPTVITCTGATASRNYYSAMTEAFYRGIPIIALTFFNPYSNQYNLAPQFVDRSATANDVKAVYVKLPSTLDKSNISECIIKLHVALITARFKNLPVHIDCPTAFYFENNNISSQLTFESVSYKNDLFDETLLLKELENKKIAIYLGSFFYHSCELQDAISKFAKSFDAAVFCDHTSNYNGDNKLLFSKAVSMSKFIKPDIVIDVGEVSGAYDSSAISEKSEIWRVSKGSIKFRFSRPVKYFFDCSELLFFKKLKSSQSKSKYYSEIEASIVITNIPDLPLSNLLVCYYLSKCIPDNSSLNVSILNSLRSLNFFDIKKTVKVNCNVGGFGIDGAVSSFIGMSITNPDKLFFGLFGDLAFFYDMNIIGNRHINNNVRIIVINNGSGEEFHLNSDIETAIGPHESDVLIAAGGHNKNCIRSWAEANSFIYVKVSSKDQIQSKIKEICSPQINNPILMEVVVTNQDEIEALKLMQNYNR